MPAVAPIHIAVARRVREHPVVKTGRGKKGRKKLLARQTLYRVIRRRG